MTAKQVTNVVFAMLPCRDDVDHTLEIMRNFGEVGSCKVWEDADGLVQVAYYDVRAAERALEELGETRCWRAQPCGNRIVRLPGTAGLDRAVVSQIRDMFVDETDDNYYILEFFDVRDAAEHRQLIAPETTEKLRDEWHPHRQAEAHHAPQMPPQMRGMQMPEMPNAAANWWQQWPEDRAIMSIAEEGVAQMGMIMPGTFLILLQGVPRELLNDSCVEAILEQAGLSEDVAKFTVHDEKVSLRGHCMLNVLSESGVYRCLNHFAGCCWGCRATLVYGELSMPACFPATQNGDGIASDEYNFDQAEVDWRKEQARGRGIFADTWNFDEAAHTSNRSQAPPTTAPKEAQPTSEASTDLSESDDDVIAKFQASVGNSAQHLHHLSSTRS
mmetsp:Transcript_37800/g.88754  ORF Transcript_37800/g.88754 Transcript_37800/m.88754 type:complete len:386 (-) Transcript_37800:314-1471(-)